MPEAQHADPQSKHDLITDPEVEDMDIFSPLYGDVARDIVAERGLRDAELVSARRKLSVRA